MKLVECDELRRYMGPKYAQIPRGAIVHLHAKAFHGWWRYGFFEYEGKKYCCPIRCLWRVWYDRK